MQLYSFVPSIQNSVFKHLENVADCREVRCVKEF
jgi:hypothetical protein